MIVLSSNKGKTFTGIEGYGLTILRTELLDE